MMMKPTSERDREFLQAWEAQELCYPKILKALRKVDRARVKLIDAQNHLVSVIGFLNNREAEMAFFNFYAAGGVTAVDWKAFCKNPGTAPPNNQRHGQLRVVASTTVKQARQHNGPSAA
jgi:hypothetical protein